MISFDSKIVLLVILLAFAQCLAQPGEGMIRVRGTKFVDRNCREFIYSGWNSWNFLEAAAGVSSALPQDTSVTQGSSYVDYKLDVAKDAGLTVGRFFAHGHTSGLAVLQPSQGSYNENLFQALDRILAAAGDRGLKLVLTFADNWKESDSKKTYTDWAGVDVDEFYTSSLVKSWYKAHISTVLNRVNSITGVQYKEDPTIFAWNLMNEPRCDCNIRQYDDSCEKPCQDNVQSWIEEMSVFVKEEDPNHLVTVGEEGFYGLDSGREDQNPDILAPVLNPVDYQAFITEFNLTDDMARWSARSGQDFVRNHNMDSIDYAAVHLWPDNWGGVPISFQSQWLTAHAQDSAKINKIMVIEEFGKLAEPNNAETRTAVRDPYFRDVYNAFRSLRASYPVKGIAFWLYDARHGDEPAGHTLYPTHAIFKNTIEPFSKSLKEELKGQDKLPRCYSGKTRSYDLVKVGSTEYITPGKNLDLKDNGDTIRRVRSASTVEACILECESANNCQSVTYNKRTGICSLKDKKFEEEELFWSPDGFQGYYKTTKETSLE